MMTYNIIVGKDVNSKKLLMQTRKFFSTQTNNKNQSVFTDYKSNFVISVYNRRIRISTLNSTSNADYKTIDNYLSLVLKNKTAYLVDNPKNDVSFLSKRINLIGL